MSTTGRFIYLSYEQIAMRMDAMVEAIRQEHFDAIVSIVRGGNFPATHLSYRTGLPIYYLKYNRIVQPATIAWIGEAPQASKLLLVEDLAGAGQTLIQCRAFLEKKDYDVQAFVIFKDLLSASTPEYIAFETSVPKETFIVPWEKTKFNPAYFTRDKTKPFVDHEFEFTAWDLDCLLETGLAITAPEDVVITERPSEDYMRVAELLQEKGVSNLVYMREEPLSNDGDAAVAAWKGDKALQLGCSRMVLACAKQAILVASAYPHVEVLWWNAGSPLAVKGTAVAQETKPAVLD